MPAFLTPLIFERGLSLLRTASLLIRGLARSAPRLPSTRAKLIEAFFFSAPAANFGRHLLVTSFLRRLVKAQSAGVDASRSLAFSLSDIRASP